MSRTWPRSASENLMRPGGNTSSPPVAAALVKAARSCACVRFVPAAPAAPAAPGAMAPGPGAGKAGPAAPGAAAVGVPAPARGTNWTPRLVSPRGAAAPGKGKAGGRAAPGAGGVAGAAPAAPGAVGVAIVAGGSIGRGRVRPG